MPTLEELYQHSLWMTLPLFFIALAGLISAIRNLIRLQRQSQLFSIPLIEHQEIEFKNAEPVVLCLRGPLLTSRFRGLTFELSRSNDFPVEGSRVWLRTRTSGFTTVTLELYRYRIPQPGRYRLKIAGLGPRQDKDSEHSILFTRPHTMKTIGYVLGIVLSSGLLIASLVFSLLRLTL